MQSPQRPIGPKSRTSVAAFVLALAPALAWAADSDIYAGSAYGGVPNVLLFLDNTTNWSAQSQGWSPGSSWNKCKNLDAAAVADCKVAIEEVFYVGKPANAKRPWEPGFNDWPASQTPTQGQVELRALRLVLRQLVCGSSNPLKVNIGLSMFSPAKGSVISNGDAVAFIYHAVQELKGPMGSSPASSCDAMLAKLDRIDANINDPATKAPSNANYGAAMYEAFKYFGGYSNPGLVTPAGTSSAGTPVSDRAYGTARFSLPMAVSPSGLDDASAYTDPGTRLNYKSPIGPGSCANNYFVLIGNSYPTAEPNNGGAVRFQPGASYLNYTPPALSPIDSDSSRYADEWAWFLANTDVNATGGIQRLFTYAVNVYSASADPAQTKLLKSMAKNGGVGSSAYIEVGGDVLALKKAFESILLEIAAINSVFSAAALPVSTTAQGTYLNQIFLGMFRPDTRGNPRWVGNLKQYQLGFVNGVLDLVDAKNAPAVLSGVGFLSPLAESFWTEHSVFFSELPSGTPPSASDRPDGPMVDKGGAAQMLRKANLQGAANRKVFTLPANPASGMALSSKPFSTANADVTAAFTNAEIGWARGENNVASPSSGVETFNGSYDNGGTPTPLGPTGARHSIHGDVMHSRPLAFNYGSGDVVVFYGSNDGFFRAVDGNQAVNGGQELWSFIAPEQYGLLSRLRDGAPRVQLPETDSAGATLSPLAGWAKRDYGMDGPIGVYARYVSDGSAVTEAFIYPTMRRGGRTVYAFDVTSKMAPVFLWKITGGVAPWTKLAQTWSMPKPVVLKSSSATPPVLLFMGGGYDPAEDQNTSSGIGNVIYIINGRTGAQVAALATDYSVPADITIVDVNGDGEPDRAYAVDVRGNIYRIDFPTAGDLAQSATWSGVTARKIAALGGKVFFAADVVVTTQFVAVIVGTGDREKPLMVSTSDNFFFVKDTVGAPRNSVIGKSDLTRVAKIDNATMQPTLVNNAASDEEGCYVELATNGEKVVNGAFTIAGVTYFGTNRPAPPDPNSCGSGLGEAYAYQFPLFCRVPTLTRLHDGGLPPSPVGGIVQMIVNGQPVKVPFVIGGGAGGSSFRPGQPAPPISPVRTRLNWRIDNANR